MALINFLEASVPLTKTFRMTKGGSVEKDHETHENTNKTMTDAPLMMEEREQRDAALLRQALEALEGMEKWASSIYDGYPPSTASIAAAPYREAARAAIAKATGKVK